MADLPPVVGRGPYFGTKDYVAIPIIEIAAGLLDARRRGEKLSKRMLFLEWSILNGKVHPSSEDEFIAWMDEFEQSKYWTKNYRPTRTITRKGSIPAELRWEVLERDNFTCKKCGSRKHLAADHIQPESKGGKTTIENLQTLCKRCNSKKGNRIDG